MIDWDTTMPAPKRATRHKAINARYDASITNDNNRLHWQNADFFSANAANLPFIRRDLRARSRYERENNTYLNGIVSTLANDTIGTGPVLQMLTDDPQANKAIESLFDSWAVSVNLPEKLRTLRSAKCVDGESFAMLIDNRSLKSPVTLDVRLYEADQVSAFGAPIWTMTDGITLDENGVPLSYTLLKQHPGDLGPLWFMSEQIPASAMIHWFRPTRPGQVRGIPETTPALPLFAMLRDYTLATLDAAKAAAYFTAILKTNSPASGEATSLEPMDTINLERNTVMTMPEGWDINQVRAEHPTNTYKEFKNELINEIARCFNMPFNVAAGNSSAYNYASGRMDHQVYFKSLKVEQADCEAKVLDRILSAWLFEASRIEGYLPQSTRRLSFVPTHQWFWNGQEHVDPSKEADAQKTRLLNRTTTLADEYARKGQDWEVQLNQIAKELNLMEKLGIEPVAAFPEPPETASVAPSGGRSKATVEDED